MALMRMRAITVYRPWAYAIMRLGKDLENRPGPPPSTILGQVIAIHAALKYDHAGAESIREMGYSVPAERWDAPGCIVCTARVSGYVTKSKSPWFKGPYGWQLVDVVAFEKPIMCTGAQGIWFVPEGLLQAPPPKQAELFA